MKITDKKHLTKRKLKLLKSKRVTPDNLHYLSRNPAGLTIYLNSYVAIIYGVNSAIFFNHVLYWITKNEENGRELINKRYWTYGSLRYLSQEYFPFFTVSQLRTAINPLVEDGLIIKGNFNKKGYDRTTWYTINKLRAEVIFGIPTSLK